MVRSATSVALHGMHVAFLCVSSDMLACVFVERSRPSVVLLSIMTSLRLRFHVHIFHYLCITLRNCWGECSQSVLRERVKIGVRSAHKSAIHRSWMSGMRTLDFYNLLDR